MSDGYCTERQIMPAASLCLLKNFVNGTVAAYRLKMSKKEVLSAHLDQPATILWLLSVPAITGRQFSAHLARIVASGTPSCFAIRLQLKPSCRSRRASSTLKTDFGR